MKTVRFFIIVLAGLLLLGINGCKESTTEPKSEPVNEAEVLVKYLEENGDYINSASCPSIVSASDVRTLQLSNPTRQYIIDLRAAADFTAGHIDGAKNVTVAGLLDHIKTLNMANYDRVVLVCYTGQTSAFGTALMRLMGYDKVFSLKFGMSSWAATFAENYWKRNIGNAQAAAFVKTPSPPKNPVGSLPALNTGKTTGPEILEARVRELLNTGYAAATISHTTLFSNLSNYYIINYWPESQYLDPGHIPGAIQYTPRVDLKSTTNLKTLPTDKTIVLYCYTGQTSSFVAAEYLRLLGYDAKSLLYGASALIYDQMVAKGLSTWKDSEIMNYPFVTGQ